MSTHKPHLPKPDDSASVTLHDSRLLRWVFMGLGFVFVGLGVVGAFVPLMPTTVFILLAGWCWAKSSRRFHRWIMEHKIFGKMITDWQQRHAMPRRAKYLAWTMMGGSTVYLFYRLPTERLWVAGLVALICLATAIWMMRLPDA